MAAQDTPAARVDRCKNGIKNQLTAMGEALREMRQGHISAQKAEQLIRDRLKVSREQLDAIEALVSSGLCPPAKRTAQAAAKTAELFKTS
ncbi:hypothetical protein [Oceanicaulis sp.]|uniref:hypothetical protein n=1 Tax=Oceanicaulis sp. TaxID=1924941 RepID=UPI003F70F5F4